ncbi:GIY-YIG nuclease family protein [Streptomyces lydicamycinicus]|uniref:GIY-YIG nuclease family protein n=1 Tax=Streptomyces lydicamycinicus TaxID=1546107 RepID=UPI003C309246
MNERTAVYRLFDSEGRLLYVGISNDPGFRWKQHRGDKQWWQHVADKTVTWYDTRMLALQAEALAIHTEAPMYNTVKPYLISDVPDALSVSREPSAFDRQLRAAAEHRARMLAEFEDRDSELRGLLVKGRAEGKGPSHMAKLTGFTREWVAKIAPDPKKAGYHAAVVRRMNKLSD